MKTVLGEAIENATIYVDIPVGGHTIDPRTGNPIPNQRAIEVQAYFKILDSPPKQFEQAQPQDTPMLWVEGWVTQVVDPLLPGTWLPPELPERVGEMLKCAIGGVMGRLYIKPKIPNGAVQQYVDPSVLGQELWGWFDAAAS